MTTQLHRRRGNSLLVLLPVLLMSFLFFNCFNKPLQPVAPTWDVALTVPVGDQTYSLGDIVSKDSSLLSVTPGSTQLVYTTMMQAAPTVVGDRLALAGINTTSVSRLGPFALSPVQVDVPVNLPGVVFGSPVPPASNVRIADVATVIPSLQEMVLKSGSITLTIQNNLPVPLTVDSAIVLRNSSGTPIALFPFAAPIPAHGSAGSTASLAETDVTHDISITNIVVSESGSAQTLQSANPLVVNLTTSNLEAHRAVLTTIPSQMLVDNAVTTLQLNDSTKAQRVWVRSGSLALQFRSGLALNITLRYKFDKLYTPSGAVYADSVNLPAGTTVNRTIDLSRWSLHSTDGSLMSSVQLTSTVNMYEGSRGTATYLSETDSVLLQAQSTQIVVDSLVGAVKPLYIAVDQRVPLHLGDLSGKLKGSLQIPMASLRLTPHIAVGVPMDVNLAIEARNAVGTLVSRIDVPKQPTKAGTAMTPISLDQTQVGTFLSAISAHLPDSLRVVGYVVANPDYDTSTVAPIGRNSAFSGDVDLSIPMNLSLVGGTFADTSELGSSNNGDRIDSAAASATNYGRLHFEIDNGIPLQVSMKITLFDKNKVPVLVLPHAAVDSVTVTAAQVSGGAVIATSHSSRVIELTGNDVPQFNKAVYVGYALMLGTPGTQAVTFHSTDAIHVRVWSELSYQVNK